MSSPRARWPANLPFRSQQLSMGTRGSSENATGYLNAVLILLAFYKLTLVHIGCKTGDGRVPPSLRRIRCLDPRPFHSKRMDYITALHWACQVIRNPSTGCENGPCVFLHPAIFMHTCISKLLLTFARWLLVWPNSARDAGSDSCACNLEAAAARIRCRGTHHRTAYDHLEISAGTKLRTLHSCTSHAEQIKNGTVWDQSIYFSTCGLICFTVTERSWVGPLSTL